MKKATDTTPADSSDKTPEASRRNVTSIEDKHHPKHEHHHEHQKHSHHGTTEHDHKHYDEDEQHPLVKILKRIALVITAFILILLTITLSIPVGTLDSILASTQLVKLPPDYKATIGGATIIIKGQTYDQLLKEYYKEQRFEFKACLTGKKQNHIYTATGFYLPKITSQTHTSVLAELCNKETIIDLHTHPYLSCIFSDVDINSLKAVKRVNPDAIIALMCATNRFNFHGY